MSLVVNTNVASLNAQRTLMSSSSEVRTAMERLSSGSKINSAGDDAAGFAISERMTSQIRGLNMAIKNANDGLSMIATIENASQEVTDILHRIKELATQASNGINSPTDRKYLQAETDSLIAEIDRIANQTQFNGERVLHLTQQNHKKTLQVGSEAHQTFDFEIRGIDSLSFYGETQGYNLWSDSSSALGPAADPPIHSSGIDFNIVTAGKSFTIDLEAGDSAKDMVQKVNAVAADSGVYARAVTYMELRTPDGSDQTVSLKINGVSTGDFVLGFNGDPAEDAVNLIADQTKVFASSMDGGVVFMTQGEDIQLELESSNSVKVNPPWGSSETVLNGISGNDSMTVSGTVKLMSAEQFTVDRNGPDAPQFFDLDSRSAEGMWNVSLASHSSLTSFYSSEYGRNGRLNQIDVTYASDLAIAIASAGIEQISATRAYYGAIQNRLEYTISNLTGVSENTSTALSRIKDADFAVESARLAKAQVIQQSGAAMIVQANASPQLVLSLIR